MGLMDWIVMNWKQARVRCFERDNYKCRKCGAKASDVHHIIPKKFRGTDDLSNLIAVCDSCHKKLDNDFIRYGKTNYVRKMIQANRKL